MSWLKWLIPPAVCFLGVAVLVGGCLGGAIFGGIPGPDDPPHEQARQQFVKEMATAVAALGGLVFLLGPVIAAVMAIWQWVRRQGRTPWPDPDGRRA